MEATCPSRWFTPLLVSVNVSRVVPVLSLTCGTHPRGNGMLAQQGQRQQQEGQGQRSHWPGAGKACTWQLGTPPPTFTTTARLSAAAPVPGNSAWMNVVLQLMMPQAWPPMVSSLRVQLGSKPCAGVAGGTAAGG